MSNDHAMREQGTKQIDPVKQLQTLFDIQGQTAVITGGSGVLGRAMAEALAQAGVRVAIISLRAESSGKIAEAIREQGGQAIGLACDVTKRSDLERAHAEVFRVFGATDILINAAGGNQPLATTTPERSFFELDAQAMMNVYNLNFMGTVLACQVFGADMVERKRGCIVNIASMAAIRPLSRVVSYGSAKAAVVNFTQWLAVHMAQEYSPEIRVNAMSPGFFLTEQNRFLLTNPDGSYTPRGQSIIAHTPIGRMGSPDDLVSTLLWLVSPAAKFVTGVVVPVDGGFATSSGV